jgi:hypothetical protein
MLNSKKLLTLTIIMILFYSCKKKEDPSILYCKSKEVLVLELPFDKSSAKIMIYRGDEVKLLGDTIYKKNIDSIVLDSSQFYVNVSAKRGVIGWVFQKDLQKDKIVLSPKQKNTREKKAKSINIDSLNILQDSIINNKIKADTIQKLDS